MKQAIESNKMYYWWIYKITSPSNRIYIGKTKDLVSRMSKYRTYNVPYQTILRSSFNKYGFPNHKVEVIDQFESDSDFASGKEMFWIRSFMCNVNKYPQQLGLNLTDGGEGTPGSIRTSEARKKMSDSKKSKLLTLTEAQIINKRVCRAVIAHDLLGNYIGDFFCIRKAAKELKISTATISNYLHGRTKRPYRFIFKYK